MRLMRFHALGAVSALLICPISAPAAQLILNEALANEPGGSTAAEWVEVVNWPDTGTGTISLAGYRFADGNDTTVFSESIVIEPGGFVVIARRPTGANSFESVWGDGSGVWGDAESETYPVVEARMSLRNSSDTVALVSPLGTSSAIFWTSDAGDGTSVERIHPDRDDTPDNFAVATDPSGSTPGRPNSVFPARGDLKLDSVWIATDDPACGTPLEIRATITNVGFGPVADHLVRLYRDLDFTAPGSSLELLIGWWIQSLDEGESVSFSYVWTSPPGWQQLMARIDADGDDTNNEGRTTALVRHTQPLVIISEFLANPSDGPGEWVEISNRADFAVDMKGVKIGDADGAAVISPFAGSIPPEGFWVLAQDENLFQEHYPDFDGMLFAVTGWRELNNSGDCIRLIGAAGEIIDSVPFVNVYDNNRSVERTTLSASFAASGDWAASVDSSGATPGRPNSVDRTLAGRLTMNATPNPFYLSSGGTMKISLRLEIGESLTMKVFDRAGHPVCTLVDDQPAATGVVEWNGTTDDGQAVRPGPYILWVKSEPSGREMKMLIGVAP
ncbi:MAG TPA: lamin tail domain-containing protein [Acidobacteriota bacterium]|nr:lamin tail domain-containing protein [Acidobacteriota bacterium]